MLPSVKNVKLTYYTLTLFQTLAASLIWGINTLFLLDAGLSNAQAFTANAFFTIGQVLFEIPTGVIADIRGRRLSYILGAATLLITTLAYFWLWQIHGPFWAWALVSVLLGLGFTFFSGATEAWLVDALNFNKFTGSLESVFAKGQVINGGAMLIGSVGGGLIAQATNLGVPYIVRAAILGITLIIALIMMRDWGFTPQVGKSSLTQAKAILSASLQVGIRNRPVRWIMLGAPFTAGVGFYVFYAMQPHLLQLYGNPKAYGIAGLAAAIVACAQIAGGLTVNYLIRFFRKRTTILISATALSTLSIFVLGFVTNFPTALVLIVVWALLFSMVVPVRQAYLNGLIESGQRATVISFDSLIGSTGGVVAQPILGRTADVFGYAQSYLVSAIIQSGAIPFLIAARKQKARSDEIAKS